MPLPDINISTILVYVFGGGGIIGGLGAFLKYRREGEDAVVERAKDTVEAQDVVLKNLRFEIRRLVDLVDTLNVRLAERDKQIDEMRTLFLRTTDEVRSAVHEDLKDSLP